jgi:uncharacterized protein (AIM24 family)
VTLSCQVVGDVTQVLVCDLAGGDGLYAEAGKLLYKTDTVQLETRVVAGPAPAQPEGSPAPPSGAATHQAPLGREAPASVGSRFGRVIGEAAEVGRQALAGEGLALQFFQGRGAGSQVAFAGMLPGKVVVLELDGTGGWYVAHAAFLCAEESVSLEAVLSGAKTGVESGEGLALGHFTGKGTLAVTAAGSVVELDPAEHGGRLQVHSGCLVAFQDGLSYGVERIGALDAQTAVSGVLGGEGFYFVTVQGKGRILLQSTTHPSLSERLVRAGLDKIARTL